MFDRKELSSELQNMVIDALFLSPFNEMFNKKIQAKDLQSDQIAIIWAELEIFLGELDALSKEEYSYQVYYSSDPETKSISKPRQSENALNFKSKIALLIQAAVEKKAVILKKGANDYSKMIHLFNDLEDVDSQVLHAWFENNFDFISLLKRTDNLTEDNKDNTALRAFFLPFDDTVPEQQTRLVAMNNPLYGNYNNWGENSFYVFSKNASISAGESRTIPLLEEFFFKIGLDPFLVKILEALAVQELVDNNVTTGCILQFFDESDNLANAEDNVYVSYSWGIPIKHLAIFQIISGEYPLGYKHSMNLQFRLVTSNATTLNPYFTIRMVRHELLESEISQRILTNMKRILKAASVDRAKCNAYINKLNSCWGAKYE